MLLIKYTYSIWVHAHGKNTSDKLLYVAVKLLCSINVDHPFCLIAVIFVLGGSTAVLMCVLLLMVAVVIPCLVVKVRRSPTLDQKDSPDSKLCMDV